MAYGRSLMYSNPIQYGDDVEQLQVQLSSLNYKVGLIDGRFGQSTKSAVEAFQAQNALEVDGIVGPDTWNRIFGSNALSADCFTLNGYVLEATYGDKIIHLKNTPSLRAMVANELYGALTIAKKLKSNYRDAKGIDINIKDFSMALEIHGHVYPGKIADAAVDIPIIGEYIRDFIYDKIGDIIDVIDMGERSVDGNRWIWDALSALVDQKVKFPELLK